MIDNYLLVSRDTSATYRDSSNENTDYIPQFSRGEKESDVTYFPSSSNTCHNIDYGVSMNANLAGTFPPKSILLPGVSVWDAHILRVDQRTARMTVVVIRSSRINDSRSSTHDHVQEQNEIDLCTFIAFDFLKQMKWVSQLRSLLFQIRSHLGKDLCSMHREGHFFADTFIHRSSITRQQHQVSTTLKNFDFFSDAVSRRQVVISISWAWEV